MKQRLFIFAVLVMCLLAGCGHQTAKHTHIIVPALQLHIWSYSPVATTTVNGVVTGLQGYAETTIQSNNATVALQGGSTIKITSKVVINGVTVPAGTRNVFVAKDGKVEINSYIRTFK